MKRLLFILALACGFASASLAQTPVTLAPVAHAQFLDATGAPLAGGKLCTYLAGTTTPQATYTDSSGTLLNSNPVILDGGGFATIWLNSTLNYKFVLLSAGTDNTCATGTQQWTVDNINPTILNQNNVYTGINTFNGSTVFNGSVLMSLGGNSAIKPVAADSIQFVTFEGNDSNDGLSLGTAKHTIPAAVISLGAYGGIVDARGDNPNNIAFTSTIAIPANVTVLLGPYTWICGVSSAPCFSLTGQGAKLLGSTIGTNAGNGGTGGPGWPGTQSGTIIRMNTSLIGSTTDGVAVNPSPAPYAGLGGFEVGNLTIDFNNTGSTFGRYCVATYSMMRSSLHDISCFNPGINGFEFENTENGWSYDDTLERLFVRQAPVSAFDWNTTSACVGLGPCFADMDRWTMRNLYYAPADGNNANYTGTIPFHIQTSGLISQDIADFSFTNIWVGGGVITTPTPTNNGFQIDQGGAAYVENINIEGEIESLGSLGNTALKVNSASPNLVVGIHFQGLQFNFQTPTNLSSTVASSYTTRGFDSPLNTFQGLLLPFGPTPTTAGCPTVNNNNLYGLIFPTTNGCYSWLPETDGIVHVWRLDTGPTELWRLDMPNNRIIPAADNTGSLGVAANRWASVDTYQLDIASTASLTSGGGTSDTATVPGMTNSGHCSVTPTNALAAANTVGTYISDRGPDQIIVTHPVQAGMTWDIVCTAN